MATRTTKSKNFWGKPEGKTGMIFLLGILGLLGFLVVSNLGAILAFTGLLLGKIVLGLCLALLIYIAIDKKARTVVSYMFKSVMRSITSLFITIDPIGILKNYIDDLKDNLKKMNKQIGNLKGQMRKLKNIVKENNAEIENNMLLAKRAKQTGDNKSMLLASRKAARLQDSNKKYTALHSKMAVLYKVLTKMETNSQILLEDTEDQVRVKEQERKAIRASHSAMSSAMSIIKGDVDKRAMFDEAMEVIADDVSNKVGEMERFMEMSSDFMNSVDLQNGVFEEKGLQMLEEYEKQSSLLLLGGAEKSLDSDDLLDLKELDASPATRSDSSSSKFDSLFD